MADGRSAAIATAVTGTTFYNPLRANAFAEELLSHEQTLLPSGAQNASTLEQIRQLNANKPFINQLAAAWDKDPAILDKLSSQLSSDPKLLARFKSSMVADGQDGNLNTSSSKFANYVKNPTKETLNKLYPEATPAPVAAAPSKPSTSTPPSGHKSKPETPATAKPPAKPAVEPATVAAAPPTPPAAPVEPITAAVKSDLPPGHITGDEARTLVNTMAGQLQSLYADEKGKSSLDSKVDGLRDRLDPKKFPKTADAYAQSLADKINANPELLKQINDPKGKGGMDEFLKKFGELDGEKKDAIRNGLKSSAENFLDNPEMIADNKWRDGLKGKAFAAAAPEWAKTIAKTMDIDLANFDISQIVDKLGLGGIGSLIQSAIAMAQEFMSDLKNGKHSDQFARLANGTKDLLSGVTGKPTSENENVSDIHPKTGQVHTPRPSDESVPPKPPQVAENTPPANSMNSLNHMAPANGPSPPPATIPV